MNVGMVGWLVVEGDTLAEAVGYGDQRMELLVGLKWVDGDRGVGGLVGYWCNGCGRR